MPFVAGRLASPAFVGREHEVAEAESALARARSGRSTTILVAGEAGVGKTRFIDELARGADDSGALVLEGGCVQLGEGLPFGPLIEALRRLPHVLAPDELDALQGSGRAVLSRLMPQLAGPVGSRTGVDEPDGSGQ